MTNWDWERFGDDIRRTVQDAVDSRNFDKLNQTINDTIHQAADGIGKGLHSAGDAVDKGMQGMGRQARNLYKSSPYTKENAGNDAYRQAANRGTAPDLYGKTAGRKAGAAAMAAAGYVFGGLLIAGLAVIIVRGFVTGGLGILLQILLGLGIILLAASLVLAGSGTSMLGKVRRFRAYIKGMEGKEYGDIKSLAEIVKKSPKFVARDIEKMIQKGWFKQGHLDRQRTCFMVTDKALRQYEDLMSHMEAQRQQEKAAKEQQEKAFGNMDPQIKEIVRTGDEYIKKIRACNDAIPGLEISAKISRMETLVDKIFDRVEQNPDCVPEIRRLMEYYLPTTVKLLEAYEELDAQPVQGENIISSKKEIEKSLDTLNVAFEKLLDSLFQDTAWDVSADISVLNTMLAQEGLTKEDF